MAGGAESASAAVLAAAFAALGFVGKEIWVLVKSHFDQQRQRRGRLVQLSSMLSGMEKSFQVQKQHRETLREKIQTNHPDVEPLRIGETLDDYFTRAHAKMNDEERKLHAIIRSITVYSLCPLNRSVLKWLQEDDYFKGAQEEKLRPLSAPLAQLEVHLLLWLAKYEVWMQDERRALVYVSDEDKHGVEFPYGIETLVQTAIDQTSQRIRMPVGQPTSEQH